MGCPTLLCIHATILNKKSKQTKRGKKTKHIGGKDRVFLTNKDPFVRQIVLSIKAMT